MRDFSRVSPTIVLVGLCFATFAHAAEVPVPTPRPHMSQMPTKGKFPTPEKATPKPFQGPEKPTTLSVACVAELELSGAKYKITGPVRDQNKGCFVADPVILLSLGKGIDLESQALLDCPTAARFATFVHQTMQVAAMEQFGSGIRTVRHDSAYVCRPRNGMAKLSEHAFGRAVDIGSITLENGMAVPVMTMGKDRELEATFLATVRAAACGPFATVLGPGSDADHALHFHFDMAPRKGKPFCR